MQAERGKRPVWLVGIDEAGYGPLLGPLVVGATVWEATVETSPRDGWKRLSGAVCRKSKRRDARVPVDDSKQVYDRQVGIASLERTVLAFAAAIGLNCERLGVFLRAIGGTLPEGPLPPWYRDLSQPLPVDPVRSGYTVAAARLRNAMAGSGLACRRLLAQVLSETHFNARVDRTRNKAAVLIEPVLRLIRQATEPCLEQDVWVHVDRLGGRQDYRALLLTAFPERHLQIDGVSDTCSRYRLVRDGSTWTIEFVVDADQQFLPVALASMVAKYVRELLMGRFNAFWSGIMPDLRPTAGYTQDAHRFLAEIQPIVARSGLRLEQFVRQR